MKHKLTDFFINTEVYVDWDELDDRYFINKKGYAFCIPIKYKDYGSEPYELDVDGAHYTILTKPFILTDELINILISNSELFKTLVLEEYKL
jgi:hypothetical protein